MTADYFSVDRRGFYQVGGTLGLFDQSPLAATLLAVDDFITPEHLRAHLKQLFPDGLSLHGWDYMTSPNLLIQTPGAPVQANYSLSLELLVEYVRRSGFPQRSSRLQSYFAFASLDEATAFRTGEQQIYRLHADVVLQLDQRWLRHGHQNAIASYCAHKYWSGTAATSPKWEHMLVPPVRVIERVK